jgi:hypothetical protein
MMCLVGRAAKFLMASLAGLAAVMPLAAQEAVPRLEVPRAEAPPRIDGELDDACWRSAARIGHLGPSRGQTLPESAPATEVRMVWDSRALHVSFACRDDDIHVDASMKRDDDLYKADVCEVFIDGKGDQRQWIEIQVSPNNQILDLVSMMTAEPAYTETLRLTRELAAREFWSDRSWTAIGLESATGRLVEAGRTVGWTVELSIPASAFLRRLGLDRLGPMELRANVLRYDHPANADGSRAFVPMNWAPVAPGCPHISPAAMGRLVLQDGADAPQQPIDISPRRLPNEE